MQVDYGIFEHQQELGNKNKYIPNHCVCKTITRVLSLHLHSHFT